MIYLKEDLSTKTNSDKADNNTSSNERANAGHVDGYVKLALKYQVSLKSRLAKLVLFCFVLLYFKD